MLVFHIVDDLQLV